MHAGAYHLRGSACASPTSIVEENLSPTVTEDLDRMMRSGRSRSTEGHANQAIGMVRASWRDCSLSDSGLTRWGCALWGVPRDLLVRLTAFSESDGEHNEQLPTSAPTARQ